MNRPPYWDVSEFVHLSTVVTADVRHFMQAVRQLPRPMGPGSYPGSSSTPSEWVPNRALIPAATRDGTDDRDPVDHLVGDQVAHRREVAAWDGALGSGWTSAHPSISRTGR